MNKGFLLAGVISALALAVRPAVAQYYALPHAAPGQNPGGLNTDGEGRFDLGQPGWNLLLTGTTATQAQPAWTPVQTLPFAFNVGGQSYNSYKVSSSGVLTFTTTATAVPPTANTALPDAQLSNNSVGFWGLMMAATNDFLISKTFGTFPNRQHWVQFNSVSVPTAANNAPISGSFLYCSIVLEETTNKVYLVWQRSGADAQTLSAGLQTNATTAYGLDLNPTTSIPNLASAAATDNQYQEIAPGTQPALDLAGNALTLPNTAALQSTVTVRGSVENLGTQAVTSATANYRVGNGPVVSAPLNSINVTPLGRANFVHPVPFTVAAGGVLQVRAWLSAPNGGVDQQVSNDTIRGTVVVGDSTLRRLVVEEVFTSATCPPCNPGNITIQGVNRTNPGKQVVVKYQQNFPGLGDDPYYTLESGARFNYYNLSAIPYMMLDGGWNGNGNSFTAPILNQYQAVPGLARVSGGYTLTGGNLVTVNAQVKPLFATPAGRLVAHTVVTERRTVNNRRSNGETVFYEVMKKMLPNENGTVLPALASGQVHNLNLSFNVATLPTTQAVEHFDSLRVVVFVQDVLTKLIYQGGYMVLPRVLASHTASVGPAFVLAPNPSTGVAAISVRLDQASPARVDVLDVTGRIVLTQALTLGAGPQEIPLNLAAQAAGVYTVRLTTNTGVQTRKLVRQ